jgi:hypothetical protein
MATSTYVALRTEVLASAVNSVTFNLSGITGYTDLVMVVSLNQATGSPQNMLMRLNGDTTSIYSDTIMSGTGSVAESVRNSSQTRFQMDRYGFAPSTGFNNNIIQIMNYSNTTTFKTILNRSNNAASGPDAMVHLWRNTAAITSIEVYAGSGGTWAVGSTFTIYGIAASSVGAKATGGTIYTDADYFYHVFAGNGTFTPTQSITADCLVVAGGGGGGGSIGGGGGAGGILAFTSQSLTTTGYTCTVGGGGAGGSFTGGTNGTNGVNSSFSALTASVGGGGGGTYIVATGAGSDGLSGGSGGGGSSANSATKVGGSGTSGQGNAGGSGRNGAGPYWAGGGGGAGAVGGNATSAAGNGGIGLNTWSSWASATGTGVSGYFAGGGGGTSYDTGAAGTGGTGGGGVGASSSATTAGSGTANTGGGGGGGWFNAGAAGSGGSGVVIIRYLKA